MTIPTLLRGKLIDLYVDLDDDTKTDIQPLKVTLQEKASKKEDPFLVSKNFNTRDQGIDERSFRLHILPNEVIYKCLSRGGTVICCIVSMVSYWTLTINKPLTFITEKAK